MGREQGQGRQGTHRRRRCVRERQGEAEEEPKDTFAADGPRDSVVEVDVGRVGESAPLPGDAAVHLPLDGQELGRRRPRHPAHIHRDHHARHQRVLGGNAACSRRPPRQDELRGLQRNISQGPGGAGVSGGGGEARHGRRLAGQHHQAHQGRVADASARQAAPTQGKEEDVRRAEELPALLPHLVAVLPLPPGQSAHHPHTGSSRERLGLARLVGHCGGRLVCGERRAGDAGPLLLLDGPRPPSAAAA
mmetsp:Transcript_50528/g.126616  ORF Transcript_50528/g.126616 Transcript_50528/m.126616 type:complete len:248 (+) Transcript_50528:572-1315(+)